MNRWLLFILLVIAPFAIMIGVNENSTQQTHDLNTSGCSRYCHDHACPHTYEKYAAHQQQPVINGMMQLYSGNIAWLQNNPLGCSYVSINLLLYVVVAPLSMALLLWGAIRKRRPNV